VNPLNNSMINIAAQPLAVMHVVVFVVVVVAGRLTS
jgi:hypothetical protein